MEMDGRANVDVGHLIVQWRRVILCVVRSGEWVTAVLENYVKRYSGDASNR